MNVSYQVKWLGAWVSHESNLGTRLHPELGAETDRDPRARVKTFTNEADARAFMAERRTGMSYRAQCRKIERVAEGPWLYRIEELS